MKNKPKKPDLKKTGVEVNDYGRRLHIYMDENPKSIRTAIEYLEQLLSYVDSE